MFFCFNKTLLALVFNKDKASSENPGAIRTS